MIGSRRPRRAVVAGGLTELRAAVTLPVLPASAVPAGTAGVSGTTGGAAGHSGERRPFFLSVDTRRARRAARSAAGPLGPHTLRHANPTGENT